MVRDLGPLLDDKTKFRQWSSKFVNALTDLHPLYGKALENLMEWADTEALPDGERGWPGDRLGAGDTAGLDVEAFNKDIRSTLIAKAAGDIQTRITNAKFKSGHLYMPTSTHGLQRLQV